MTRQLVDYLESLRLRDAAVEIILGGRSLVVRRARLRQHYALADLLGKLRFPAGATTYLSAAAGQDVTALQPSAAEIAAAFAAVRDLNAFEGTLPILWGEPSGPRDRPVAPEDYPNRALSTIVTGLARAFGWTADYILEELGPEEALCYLQEAIVAEHADRAFQFNISDASVGKGGRRQPFPALPWGKMQRRQSGQEPAVLPDHLRPGGVVIGAAEIRKRKGMPT